MQRLLLEFISSVSVKDFRNVPRLQRVITFRHSAVFQNVIWYKNRPLCLLLVALEKCMTCLFRFCVILASLKHGILHITRRVNLKGLGLDTLLNTETSKKCISCTLIQYFTVINR